MKTLAFGAPTFAFIVGTRVALAVGMGLLLSSRIPEARRRKIGAALVALGAATTIPAARAVIRQLRGRSSGPDGRVQPELAEVQRKVSPAL